MTKLRIGLGYDVHRLVPGRACVIGGVKFDHPVGLLGHSDADVLLHAICDALLGALALGDLGDHFPDHDPRYKDADSGVLLQHCYRLCLDKGYRLNNLDTVVVCETPRLNPRREEIRQKIAGLLDVPCDVISVKGTTEEGMGFTGRCEGIKAWAYVSLVGVS